MKEHFKRMDVVLNDRMDKLIEQFKKDYPEFHRQYFNARIIVDFGVRHEGEELPEEPEISPTE